MTFQKTKTDPELGERVHQYLLKIGVETPTTDLLFKDNREKIEKIELLQKEIALTLGLDLTNDSLIETPKRVAKMQVLEQNWGLLPENFPKITEIEESMDCDEMVRVSAIRVTSLCEHHFLSILGKAKIAYIPNKTVLGLSKLSRICDYFAHRPQVQERLTSQIFHTLCFLLDTENVAIEINATHLCMTTRGIEDTDAMTRTTKLGGVFKSEHHVRSEFFHLSE